MQSKTTYHPYTPLLNLEYRSRFQLIFKYDVPLSFHDIKIINDIIYNEETHYVATFKEFWIYEEMNDFLKRYYTSKEVKSKLTKMLLFYEHYSKIYANYTILPESKFMYKNIKRKQKMIDQMQGDDDNDSNSDQRQDSDDYSNVFTTLAMESINSGTPNITIENLNCTTLNNDTSLVLNTNNNIQGKTNISNLGVKRLIKTISDIEVKMLDKKQKSKCTWNLNKWTNKMFSTSKQTNLIFNNKNNNNIIKKTIIFAESLTNKNEKNKFLNGGAQTARTSLSPEMKMEKIVSSPTNRLYPFKNNINRIYKELILEKYKCNSHRYVDSNNSNNSGYTSSVNKALINKINHNDLQKQTNNCRPPSSCIPSSTENKPINSSKNKAKDTTNKPILNWFSQRNSSKNISNNIDSVNKSKSTSKNKNWYNSIINNVNIINNINTGSTQINIYTGNSLLKSLNIPGALFNSSWTKLKKTKNNSLSNSSKYMKPTSNSKSKSKNKTKVNEVCSRPKPKYDLNIRKWLYNNMIENEGSSATDRLNNNKQSLNCYEKYGKIWMNKNMNSTHNKINSVVVSKVNTTDIKSIRNNNSNININNNAKSYVSKNNIPNYWSGQQKQGTEKNKITTKTPTSSNMTNSNSYKSPEYRNLNTNANKVLKWKNWNDINNTNIIFKGSNSNYSVNLDNIMFRSDRNSQSKKIAFK